MPKRSAETPSPQLPPFAAVIAALALPGLGHVLQGRKARGLSFFVLVVGCLGVGLAIGGRLPWEFSGAPLPRLATIGTLGAGLPVILARLVFGYEADPTGAGFEYGGAFILTAGLMNLLLALDSWDLAHGRDLLPDEEPDAQEHETGKATSSKDTPGSNPDETEDSKANGDGPNAMPSPGKTSAQKAGAAKRTRRRSEKKGGRGRRKKGAR